MRKVMIFIAALFLVTSSTFNTKEIDFDLEVEKLDTNELNKEPEIDNLIKANEPKTYGIGSQSINFDELADRWDEAPNANSCFQLTKTNGQKFATSFSSWSGVYVELTIENTCSSASPIDNLRFVIQGYKLNKSNTLFFPNQSQILSNPWMNASSIVYNNGDVRFGISTQSQTESWAFIKPGQKVTVKLATWPSIEIKTFSVDDVAIEGGEIKKGSVSLNIKANNFISLCSKGCKIVIDLFQIGNNNKVHSLDINPAASSEFVFTINDLVEAKYRFEVLKESLPVIDSSKSKINIYYVPETFEVLQSAQAIAAITIDHKELSQTKVAFSIKDFNIDKYQQIRQLKVSVSGAIVGKKYLFDLDLKGRYEIVDIPFDTYVANIQGLADPSDLTDGLYTAKNVRFDISSSNPIVNAEFVFERSSGFSVNFTVNDAPSYQLVDFESPNFRYIKSPLKTGTYIFFETTSAIIEAQGYTVRTNPNPLVLSNGLLAATISFEKNKKIGVKGWPDYLAFGTITLNQGISEGTGRLFDSIFKYSGDNGAGDTGRIVYPGPAIGVKKSSLAFTNANKFPVRPVIVHYTLELSNGASIKDFEDDNVAIHLINLAHDAIVLNEPFSFSGKSYYGTIIVNPDALGFIQQQNMYENTLKNKVINVNRAVKILQCFLNLKVNYQGMVGSPIEIAKKLGMTWVDDAWSTSATNIWFPQCKNQAIKNLRDTPIFQDNFKGWIKAHNWLLTTYGPNVAFGWHENISMVPSGSLWVLKNNAYDPATAGNIQSQITNPTVNFLKELGVYDADFRPSFIAFDRYERDDTEALSYYFYNDSCWKNIITLCKQIYNDLQVPVMLWQMPGGHIQIEGDVDPRNGHGGAFGNFLFPDPKLNSDLSNVNSRWNNLKVNYCKTGTCSVIDYLKENNYNWSTDHQTLNELSNSGIFAILLGGGTGPTTGINVYPSDDGGWLSSRINQYYKSLGVAPENN